jgi:nucleolar protein 4
VFNLFIICIRYMQHVILLPRHPSSPLLHSRSSSQARFDVFGPVKSARLVLNKETGKPKGTAFIEFRESAAAAAAAHASAQARSGRGVGVTLKGRPLDVDVALSQQGARQLAAATGTGPEDRRNLYLGKEGTIEEGSAAWRGMSEHDR